MRTGQFVPSFTSQRDYIDLDLGTGGFSEPIVAMGGEARSPGENVRALIEAIEIIRAMWSGAPAAHYSGNYYRLTGIQPGPRPVHEPQKMNEA